MTLHLARRLASALRPPPMASTCWADTQPMALAIESAPQPRSFRQALAGLQVSELTDDDLFQHYFGAPEPGAR